MRLQPLFSLLLVSLLAACATQKAEVSAIDRQVAQTGALRVHPGLLGRPVPPELQEPSAAPLPETTVAKSGGMDEEGLRTQRSVYFDFDSASLRADVEPMLQAHARYLAAHPRAKVRVEGNADERGPQGYNNALGLKRAESVRAAIVAKGAGEAQVVVRSLGELKPKLRGHNEESWSENRRADIVYERSE